MIPAPIVERLVALREEAGLTQGDVAARMGTSQPVIARLEAGGRDPRLSTLERYAGALGADLEVRPSTPATVGTVARLAERIRNRLSTNGEPATTTFREVVQFLDDVSSLSSDELEAAVRREPLSTGDRRWDALLAATVEWAAAAGGVSTPRWTRSSRRKLPPPGWVLTPHERLHTLVREATPAEFSQHGVYLDGASLASV